VSTAKGLGEELSKLSLGVASKENATYADFRLVHTRNQEVSIVNDNPNSEETQSLGVGVRVLYDGKGWGFADTDETDNESIRETTLKALSLAKGAAKVGGKVNFAKEPSHVDSWEAPAKKDPFRVSLEDKYALLRDATDPMKNEGVVMRRGGMSFTILEKYFSSSEGSKIHQKITYSGAGLVVAAKGVTGLQRRSIGNGVGQYTSAGYETVEELHLPEQAPDLAKDALALGNAKKCKEGKSDIILSSDQVALQVHESCGHPIELDRALGYEANFAGRSFLTPDKLGKLQYGSEHVNIVMDATINHGQGLGTFAYDDEGVKAQRKYAIEKGKFVGYLMSRETASKVGQTRSNGCMRAEGYKLPIIRMTNVSLEPGDWKYDELIEDTKDGILMITNYGWSIDQKRYNFQFNCEKGYEIHNGSLGEMIRGPGYNGITPEFWNSCDAICDKNSWTLWGTPNCGKGQPGQVMVTGHGASPARFRNVKVFGA
jgi:TldD protein